MDIEPRPITGAFSHLSSEEAKDAHYHARRIRCRDIPAITLDRTDANAVVCGRGPYRAGCVGPHGAVVAHPYDAPAKDSQFTVQPC